MVVDFHQRSVSKSLQEWGKEYSAITNAAEAERALEMTIYIERYYQPGDGYRGSKAVEEELERQRQLALETIFSGLERFSGQRFGTNREAWELWLKAEATGLAPK